MIFLWHPPTLSLSFPWVVSWSLSYLAICWPLQAQLPTSITMRWLQPEAQWGFFEGQQKQQCAGKEGAAWIPTMQPCSSWWAGRESGRRQGLLLREHPTKQICSKSGLVFPLPSLLIVENSMSTCGAWYQQSYYCWCYRKSSAEPPEQLSFTLSPTAALTGIAISPIKLDNHRPTKEGKKVQWHWKYLCHLRKASCQLLLSAEVYV